MMERNKIDKSFGPVGTSAGVVLFVAGLILTVFYLTGLLLVMIGGFVGFSFSGAIIDYDNEKDGFTGGCKN